jgi:hypothetical protein
MDKIGEFINREETLKALVSARRLEEKTLEKKRKDP